MGESRLPKFAPAVVEFECAECQELNTVGAPRMVWTDRESQYGRVVPVRKVFCQDCGELLIESLDR